MTPEQVELMRTAARTIVSNHEAGRSVDPHSLVWARAVAGSPAGRVTFTVPGEPQGKGRARVIKIAGATRMKTPEKTLAYEGLIAHEARIAMAGRALIEVPCSVRVEMVCSVPASWSMKKQRQALEGLIRPAKKPDVDNILKAVHDGINGVVWKDDVQGVDGAWTKRYGNTPGVTVTVIPLTAEVREPALEAALEAMP